MRAAVLFAVQASIATLAACQRPPAAIKPTITGAGGAGPDAGGDLPVIPVGLDAFREWDRWPVLRIGDAHVHAQHLRPRRRQRGRRRQPLPPPGGRRHLHRARRRRARASSTSSRTNHWHGSPWHYVVDGADHGRAARRAPPIPIARSRARRSCPTARVPAAARADLVDDRRARTSPGCPSLFAHRCASATGARTTAPATTSTSCSRRGAGATLPATWRRRPIAARRRRRRWLGRAGAGHRARRRRASDRARAASDMPAAAGVGGADLRRRPPGRPPCALSGSTSRRAAPRRSAGRASASPGTTRAPSVDAPVALFFGAGTLYNRDGPTYLVKALPGQRALRRRRPSTLAMLLPDALPARRAHRAGRGGRGRRRRRAGRCAPSRTALPGQSAGYFHATYRDHGDAGRRARTSCCSTRRSDEGGGDWCGSFVGHVVHLLGPRGAHHARGRSALLLRRQPDAAGAGHRHRGVGRRRRLLGRRDDDAAASPGTRRARPRRGGAERRGRDRVGVPLPPRRRDALRPERAHPARARRRRRLDGALPHGRATGTACPARASCRPTRSTSATPPTRRRTPTSRRRRSRVDTLTSRYEWGVDHAGRAGRLPGDDRHRAATRPARRSSRCAIAPDNLGVLLRRKLDYGFADQRAEVLGRRTTTARRLRATPGPGTWRARTRCVYSNPPASSAPPSPSLETSNRRFRDDEFLIPRALTAGRASRSGCASSRATRAAALPGHRRPTRPTANWSEIRYDAYVWKLRPHLDAEAIRAALGPGEPLMSSLEIHTERELDPYLAELEGRARRQRQVSELSGACNCVDPSTAKHRTKRISGHRRISSRPCKRRRC